MLLPRSNLQVNSEVRRARCALSGSGRQRMPTSHADERPAGAAQDREGERRDRPRTASRGAHVAPIAAASVWLSALRLPLPQRQDHVVFLRGVPVAPWMTKRPWQTVWSAWLARLEVLFAEWDGSTAGS